MRNCFSLNIDEAANASYKKIFTISVSCFSFEKSEVVVCHLKLLSLQSVTSSILFDSMTALFDDNNIPWNQLISILLDSCGVMIGEKSCLEVRLREGPILMEILCTPFIHNASKKNN